MATQPATPIKQGMEIKEPPQFQFKRVGDTLSGIFYSIEPATITDQKTGKLKETTRYIFLDDETRTQRTSCLETNDLKKKLWPGLLGFFLNVRYDNDDASFAEPGQNAMKVFKITTRSSHKEPGFENIGAF